MYKYYILFFLLVFNKSYTLSIERLIGKIDPSKDEQFVNIRTIGIPTSNNKDIFLLKEAACHLKEIYQDFHSKFPFIPFVIISGFRSYDHQKRIWERKWDKYSADNEQLKPDQIALSILRYSSMPGTSRHHWGTEIDITSLNNNYFETQNGRILYKFLKTNMDKYGFFQPYTAGRNSGYYEEKWHWSYKALSENYLKDYNQILNSSDFLLKELKFKGSDKIQLLKYIHQYVFSINHD